MAPNPTRGRTTGTVAAVCAAVFADSLLYSVIVPVLPRYAERLGATPFAVGLLFASYAVALLAATPVLAAVSDRVGRRTPLLLGLAAVAGATLLFGFATSYPQLVAARSVQGLAAAAVWTVGVALVAESVPPGRLGVCLGTVMASMSAGLVLGPPLGGLLVEAHGYRATFLVCAGVVVGCLLLQVVLVREPSGPREAPVAQRKLLADPALRRTLVAVAAAAASLSMLEPLLPLDLAERYGAGARDIGLVFGAATLAHLLSSPVLGALADRWSARRLMPAGLVAAGVLMPLLWIPRSTPGVAVVLVLFAVAYGLVLVPALPEIGAVVRAHGGSGYAGAYGAFNIAYAVGMVAGPVAGSAAASRLTLGPVLVGFGALLAAGGALLMVRRPARSNPDPHHIPGLPTVGSRTDGGTHEPHRTRPARRPVDCLPRHR